MNKNFLAAAVVTGILVPAHIIGGGPEIHLPMLGTELAPEVKAALSVVWHGISLILILNTGLLIGAATGRSWGRAAAAIVGLQSAGFAALFVVYGILRLGNLTQMPQWTAFLLIAVLCAVGLWRGAKNPVQS